MCYTVRRSRAIRLFKVSTFQAATATVGEGPMRPDFYRMVQKIEAQFTALLEEAKKQNEQKYTAFIQDTAKENNEVEEELRNLIVQESKNRLAFMQEIDVYLQKIGSLLCRK